MITIVAMFGLASVRALALLIEFDADASYYAHDAVLPTAFSVGSVIAIVIAFLFVLLLRRDLGEVTADADSSAVIFSASTLSFVIIGGAFYNIILESIGTGVLGIASLILAFPAAAYFLLSVALPIRSQSGKVIMAVLMILWMFANVVSTYFKGGIEINNPNKSLMLTAMAVVLIYLVSEGRFLLGTERRGLYVFSGLTSLLLLGLYSLPNAVLIMIRAYPDIIDPMRELTMLALFAYVLIRMCVVSGMIGDEYDDGEYENEYEENDGEYDAEPDTLN